MDGDNNIKAAGCFAEEYKIWPAIRDGPINQRPIEVKS